ncbi:MAG: ABC-F family ATP-binding cassette domain-containing protein [Lachnospiraceae bacterium]
MNLLTIENLTKSYTDRKLFDKASFSLQEGEKVGILGINGTGKSTLLKIIAGLEEADEGNLAKANHVVIRYLPQNPILQEELTVLESVLKQNQTKENQWSIESEAKTMLTKVGVYDFAQRVAELSGGQKKRLALVSVLLAPADILILDEPTNHLDNEMSDWLEDMLKKRKGALLMVTHDRYFLDSVANRIVEIDKGAIYSYQTNYSGFLALKAEREDIAIAGERKRQSILKKEIEWMQRGARARATKQKAHIQRYEELKNRTGPQTDAAVEMSSISTRLGRTTVEVEHLYKAYGSKVLIQDFTYIFLKNDRVGFVGKKGAVKTTLMKLIEGRLAPDRGTVTIGQTVKIGYYAQEIEKEQEGGIAYMNPEKKVIDYMKETAEFVRTSDGLISASAMLERFLFPPEQQYSPIAKLSGGERRRLNLLRVLMEAPNVLILDEPTNDLDITTLTILEDYLDSYEGIVITVSHDRYFLDRTVGRIFSFEEGGRLCQHEGGYTEYANWKEMQAESVSNVENSTRKTEEVQGKNWKESQQKKLKFTYQEQKDYEVIEDEIEKIETELAGYDVEILAAATNYGVLHALTQKKEEAEKRLEEKMQRWEYLEDLKGRIQEQE